MRVFSSSNQRLLFLISAAFLLLIPLAYLRKNEEFIFFSGILFSLVLTANRLIYAERIWLLKYTGLSLVYFALSLVLGKSSFSLKLPLVTLSINVIFFQLFTLFMKRTPASAWSEGTLADRFYQVLLVLVLFFCWIALIIAFVDK